MERLGRGLDRPVHDFEHGFGREAADPGDNPHSGVYAGTWGPGRLLVASGANTLILGYTPGVRRVSAGPGCPAGFRRNRGKPLEIRSKIRTNLKKSEKNLKKLKKPEKYFSDFFRFFLGFPLVFLGFCGILRIPALPCVHPAYTLE